ncbi:MAG: hypothetical protein QM754_06985 [Tepidisphaeraceae bacterium]
MKINMNNLDTLPAKSAAAVIALMSAGTCCHPSTNGTDGALRRRAGERRRA